ncbi:MAG: hypothetical protein LBP89_04760, partial [Helicobacteraceae bacterium]|nr:hypothetical protein [Helicobacteraceae bacterium]
MRSLPLSTISLFDANLALQTWLCSFKKLDEFFRQTTLLNAAFTLVRLERHSREATARLRKYVAREGGNPDHSQTQPHFYNANPNKPALQVLSLILPQTTFAVNRLFCVQLRFFDHIACFCFENPLQT